jgi:perosamine synthetase
MSRREVAVGGFKTSPRARRYVLQALDSGRLSYGPFHRRFEAAFAAEHDAKHAVFLNSGTSALHIALQALKERHRWKDGDEVIVPSVTFVATANIVLHNRMKPVFADVDARTYSLNPSELERKMTRRTRAVIPVHLLGLPADMDPIMALARRHRLKVIEDSSETMFARYAGRMVGSIGDIGCFSTYMAHYLVTGVGGLAITSDRDLHVRLRSLMNHGRDSIYLSIDDDAGASGRRLHEIVAKRFKFVTHGHSFRCTELEAALGLAQLEEKDGMVKARVAMAARLSEGLRPYADRLQLPWCPPGREHTYMLYGLVLRGKDKAPLVNFLEDRGVETRDLLPLIGQPVYRKLYGDLRRELPVAAGLGRSGFYIGCHPYMTASDADYVVEQFASWFKRH